MADCQRKFSCTIRVRPAAAAAATMARASAIEAAKGFWQIMCTPAAAASSTSGRWLGTVVAMSTKSSCSAREHLRGVGVGAWDAEGLGRLAEALGIAVAEGDDLHALDALPGVQVVHREEAAADQGAAHRHLRDAPALRVEFMVKPPG